MLFIGCILLFLLRVRGSHAECNVCLRNFVACASRTTFSVCVEGKPTTSIIRCPANTVCNDDPKICIPDNGDSRETTCDSSCGVCGSYGRVFTCESESSFAFCFGKSMAFYPSGGRCKDGYICNLNSREICVKANENKPSCVRRTVTSGTKLNTTTYSPAEMFPPTLGIGIPGFPTTDSTIGYFSTAEVPREPSSTIDSTVASDQTMDAIRISSRATEFTTAFSTTPDLTSFPSTTALPFPTINPQTEDSSLDPTTLTTVSSDPPLNQTPRNANEFCSDIAKSGLFRKEGDTTCKRFYLCVVNNGSFGGIEYSCPANQFFNSEVRMCQKDKPDNCTQCC